MRQTRRQHFLPRFYLEGFCRDGRLWVYDRERDSYRHQRPIKIAVRKHYYSVSTKAAEDPLVVEKFLGRIEAAAGPIISKVDNCEELSSDERIALALFSALLMSRVPQYQEDLEAVHDQLYRRLLREVVATPERAKAIADDFERSTGTKLTSDPLGWRRYVLDGEYRIRFPRELSIASSIEMAKELTPIFVQMDWTFYHATEDELFVTTDNPFFLARGAECELKGPFGAGVITPGVRKVLPLSGRSCLVMGDRGDETKHASLSRAQVKDANLLTARNCHWTVMGTDRAALETIVENADLAGTSPEPRVRALT